MIANGGLRLGSLSYDEARTILSGEDLYLGYLTGQDRTAAPVLYDDEAFLESLASYFFDFGGEASADTAGRDAANAGVADREDPRSAFTDELQLVDSRKAAVDAVQGADGGLAVIPAEWLDSVSGPRTVAIYQTSIAVHPDILELQAGRRLNKLEPEQVRALLTGEALSWDAVGGPRRELRAADVAADDSGEYEALPVTPVFFGGGSAFAERQQRLVSGVLGERDGAADRPAPENSVMVNTSAEFAETLRSTPGAIGVVSRDIAVAEELPVIEVQNVESSLNLRPSFFVTPPRRAGAVGGVSTIILNTLAMIAFVLLIATPIGVAGAIYLVEYARQGRLLTILRIGTDTLAGIPSIVFGLFGLVFFAQFLGFQTGLLSGTLTLTLMILPTVVRTSEEALRAVSKEVREGSLALGATKLQTIFRVVLPSAAPGILTGMILGIGRAVGETAALLYTMGSNLALLQTLNSPVRVLSIHLYLLVRETISLANAFAAATILVIIVIIVNYLTRSLIGRMTRMAA